MGSATRGRSRDFFAVDAKPHLSLKACDRTRFNLKKHLIDPARWEIPNEAERIVRAGKTLREFSRYRFSYLAQWPPSVHQFERAHMDGAFFIQ